MNIVVNIVDSEDFYEFKDVVSLKEEGDWIKFFKETAILDGQNITSGLMCISWVKKDRVECIEIDEDEEEEESY